MEHGNLARWGTNLHAGCELVRVAVERWGVRQTAEKRNRSAPYDVRAVMPYLPSEHFFVGHSVWLFYFSGGGKRASISSNLRCKVLHCRSHSLAYVRCSFELPYWNSMTMSRNNNVVTSMKPPHFSISTRTLGGSFAVQLGKMPQDRENGKNRVGQVCRNNSTVVLAGLTTILIVSWKKPPSADDAIPR